MFHMIIEFEHPHATELDLWKPLIKNCVFEFGS